MEPKPIKTNAPNNRQAAYLVAAADEVMNIEELSRFIKTPVHTIYAWVSSGKNSLPYAKPGRRLLFIRSRILDWLQKQQRGGR